MYITGIEQDKGKRYKVFGDGKYLFSLYGKELKKYHIEEMTELEDTVIQQILTEVIYKRAKERALYLIEKRPYSVSMLGNKLKDNGYPTNIIREVVAFLEQYHYLDDSEYVSMYVNSYSKKKSKRQITYDLLQKGITKEIIEAYFNDVDYSEQACFDRQFERYSSGKNLMDWSVRQKVFRYFYGKGFPSSMIEEALNKQNI